jgi:hypothetical protein
MHRGLHSLPVGNPKLLIILVLVAASASGAWAQMRGGASGFHGGFRGGFTGNRSGRYAAFWGDPYFYPDYPVQSLAYDAPAPPVVVVQQTAAAAADPQRLPESVLIEWQGDHYARSNSQDEARAQQDYSEAASRSVTTAAADLPPAVLIYRDGHREQVFDYVIESGKLYARGNYWVDGYWNKTVQLAALDIPATLKANQQSGVKFVLPSYPNEVVTRP